MQTVTLTPYALAPVCSPDVYRWTSHSPEKRAAAQNDYLAEALAYVVTVATAVNASAPPAPLTQAQVDQVSERYVKLVRARWAAASRCASAMITGPARFPTERNRRRNEIEHKRLGEVIAYYERVPTILRRLAHPPQPIEGAEVQERDFDFVRVVWNGPIDRLQMVFPAKPEPATIALLKSRGFKWAPSAGAWQRQLTDNAKAVANTLLPKIREIETA